MSAVEAPFLGPPRPTQLVLLGEKLSEDSACGMCTHLIGIDMNNHSKTKICCRSTMWFLMHQFHNWTAPIHRSLFCVSWLSSRQIWSSVTTIWKNSWNCLWSLCRDGNNGVIASSGEEDDMPIRTVSTEGSDSVSFSVYSNGAWWHQLGQKGRCNSCTDLGCLIYGSHEPQ